MAETRAHLQLKRLAVATLLRWGCQAAASEVLCPISRFRLDAAGYLDAEPYGPGVNHVKSRVAAPAEPAIPTRAATQMPRKRCPARTVIVECKQSREDFLRDRANLEAALRERDVLEERRVSFLGRVMETEPELQKTDEVLFRDLGHWDLSNARHPTYRRIVRDIEAIEQRLHGGTKFCRLARYRLADRLYLFAPTGLIERREVPPGWGLMECGKSWAKLSRAPLAELSETPVEIRVEAPRHYPREDRIARLLRNIAIALTRDTLAKPGTEDRPANADARSIAAKRSAAAQQQLDPTSLFAQ